MTTKLPIDPFNVMHILPFWVKILYWAAWIVGAALVLSLLIYSITRLLLYLQSKSSMGYFAKQKKQKLMSREEVLRFLKQILDNSVNQSNYRLGLHRMSALLKSYFEILLKKEIEEMTAAEIRASVKERKDIGTYFTDLTVTQYRIDDPTKDDVVEFYNKALELINKK